MYHDTTLAELHERGVVEGIGDQCQVGLEQGEQIIVSDIAGGDHEEPAGKVLQEVAVAEIPVLRDHHAVLTIGDVRQIAVGGAIAVRQVRAVDAVVTGVGQQGG